MKPHRFNYLLLGIAFVFLATSFAARRAALQTAKQNNEADRKANALGLQAELRRTYPTVDYDEKETTDVNKQVIQRQRKRQHNNRGMVSDVPSPKDREVASYSHGQFDFPALPFEKSEALLLVSVLKSEAHMSEDKQGVYSEFDVQILEVFKAGSLNIIAGQLFTLEREGGVVKYPNGQEILYRRTNNGMPKVGERYVLFLIKPPNVDFYRILTGYEVAVAGVTPLDYSPQFESYRGLDEASFLKAVRTSASQNSQRNNSHVLKLKTFSNSSRPVTTANFIFSCF
jgi:hypothetical protein